MLRLYLKRGTGIGSPSPWVDSELARMCSAPDGLTAQCLTQFLLSSMLFTCNKCIQLTYIKRQRQLTLPLPLLCGPRYCFSLHDTGSFPNYFCMEYLPSVSGKSYPWLVIDCRGQFELLCRSDCSNRHNPQLFVRSPA